MKNVIIFGPPGIDRSSISRRLSEEFGLRLISTGDLIRRNQVEKTKIGVLADRIMGDGGLLPDHIINEMVKQEIISDNNSAGFIFDGFPRTSGQAKMLDEFMHKKKMPISAAIYLDAQKHVVLERMMLKEQGAEEVDKVNFQVKWATYMSETIPAILYFNGRGKVSTVDGSADTERVYENLRGVLI
jgi:adenylate kinase